MRQSWLWLIVVVSLCPVSCVQTLPVDVLIGSNFDEGEPLAILRAFDEWETKTGIDIITYRGRHEDGRYDGMDMSDGRHVVYKAENPTITTEFFNDLARLGGDYDGDIAGWGMS